VCATTRSGSVRIGDLPQRAARVAFLPAARLARLAAQAADGARFLLQTVAGGRLGAVRAVKPKPTAKLGQFGPKCGQLGPKRSRIGFELRDPAVLRSDQLRDFGGENHPALDSDSSPEVS